jgi:hypothetical protein
MGESDEQTIGNNDHWHYITSDAYDGYVPQHFVGYADNISSGSHTVKVYGQRLTDSSIGSIEIASGTPVVTFQALFGSGANDILTETKTLSAHETLNNGTFTDVTGLSTDIDCFENEVVGLDFQGVCERGDNAGSASIRWEIDGTTYYPDDAYAIEGYVSSVDERCNLSNSTKTDALSAGSHTVKIQAKGDQNNMQLLAGARMGTTQYRGGSVLIQENGENITYQPQALNFVDNDTVSDNYGTAIIQISIPGFIGLPEYFSDLTYSTIDGYLYAKHADGYLELFYIDDYGLTTQITKDGDLVLTHFHSHPSGKSDEIDGDKLDIDWNPSTYTPDTSPSEADSVDNLTAHLTGIDGYLLELGNYRESVDVTAHAGASNPHETTLDKAYDGSGSGSGRVITIDSGPIELSADGYSALDIDGYITLSEISDPSALENAGSLYAKEVDGYSELHYVDNYGFISQLTVHGPTSYAEIYETGGSSSTTCTSADEWYALAGSFSDGYLNNFTHSSGALTYTGERTQLFEVFVSASTVGPNITVEFDLTLFIGGTEQCSNLVSGRRAEGEFDYAHFQLVGLCPLSKNENIKLYVRASSSSSTLTLKELNFKLVSVGPYSE